LTHRWGYAPTIDALSKDLVGGSEDPGELAALLESDPRVRESDGFVCFRGQEGLIEKSRPRVIVNDSTNGDATAIAMDFTKTLLRACPLVDCVALSGSAATGGYIPTDDVDLDIFVRDGAKYLTYALALALGFLVSIRFRRGGRFRKIICINVIWTRGQTEPFARRDEALAFELLHCRPLFGALHFQQVITRNPWILRLFPQLEWRQSTDSAPPEPGTVGRIVAWIGCHRPLLALSDRLGRSLSRAVYDLAHWRKRKDVEATERLAFLRQVKFPYEFFQD
jgi:hypothetical protein